MNANEYENESNKVLLNTRIFAICFANILCVDIDEKQGIDKEKAAELVQKYAESHGLTFRLYETDRGMHAYCTSKTFDFRKEETLPSLSAWSQKLSKTAWVLFTRDPMDRIKPDIS